MLLVDVASLNREDFSVTHHESARGLLTLVHPKKSKHVWTPDERHLRSVLVDEGGHVVSAGFPKFFNAGEDAAGDAITAEGVKDGRTALVEKLDGSLIIASLVGGAVILRTRGCHKLADHLYEPVMKVVREYPAILWPEHYQPHTSALFEYVGPDNKIVLKYESPKLYYLGWSDWSTGFLRFMGPNRGPSFGLPHPERSTLSFVSLAKHLQEASDREGYVAWTHRSDGVVHLTKFKTAWYLKLHGLKEWATPRTVSELIHLRDAREWPKFEAVLLGFGFDWETAQSVRDTFEAECAKQSVVRDQLARLQAWTRENVPLSWERKRKVEVCNRAVQTVFLSVEFPCDPLGLMVRTACGEHDRAEEIIGAASLGYTVSQYRAFMEANGGCRP